MVPSASKFPSLPPPCMVANKRRDSSEVLEQSCRAAGRRSTTLQQLRNLYTIAKPRYPSRAACPANGVQDEDGREFPESQELIRRDAMKPPPPQPPHTLAEV